jgi:aspartate aminotransferase-like enzyme
VNWSVDWEAILSRSTLLRSRVNSGSISESRIGIDVAKLVANLRQKHHLVIDGGYGKLKGQTFRLSNMGDETEETVSHLLRCLDDCL